jgi:hypothetical protein
MRDLKFHWDIYLLRRPIQDGIYNYFNLSVKTVKNLFTDTVTVII